MSLPTISAPLQELYHTAKSMVILEIRDRVLVVRIAVGYPTNSALTTTLHALLSQVEITGADVVVVRPEIDIKMTLQDRAIILLPLLKTLHRAGIRLLVAVPMSWSNYRLSLQLDEQTENQLLRYITCPDMEVTEHFIESWLHDHPKPGAHFPADAGQPVEEPLSACISDHHFDAPQAPSAD